MKHDGHTPHLRRKSEDRPDVDLVRLFSLHLLLKLLQIRNALVPEEYVAGSGHGKQQ